MLPELEDPIEVLRRRHWLLRSNQLSNRSKQRAGAASWTATIQEKKKKVHKDSNQKDS